MVPIVVPAETPKEPLEEATPPSLTTNQILVDIQDEGQIASAQDLEDLQDYYATLTQSSISTAQVEVQEESIIIPQ